MPCTPSSPSHRFKECRPSCPVPPSVQSPMREPGHCGTQAETDLPSAARMAPAAGASDLRALSVNSAVQNSARGPRACRRGAPEPRRCSMRVFGQPMRTIRPLADGSVEIIDQTRLPWSLEHVRLTRLEDAARAIADMLVRGAPLIGVTAAYGLALALRDDPSDAGLEAASATLLATRPTAVNLAWALARTARAAKSCAPAD